MPHFFTLSNFSTATPRETSSAELGVLWFDDPIKRAKIKLISQSTICYKEMSRVMAMSEDVVRTEMGIAIPGCGSLCWPG